MTCRVWRVDGIVDTKSQFFSRILHCAFRDLPFLVDADATMVEATRLALQCGHPPQRAFRDAFIVDDFHRGGVRVSEHETLASRYPEAATIERSLFASQRIGRDCALLATLEWLTLQDELPTLFSRFDEICFDHVFEFTPCELEIVFRLAELSLPIKFILPIDFEARGLLLPIQDLLTQLESRSESLPITIETPPMQVSSALTPFFNALFVGDAKEESGVVRASLTNQFDAQIDWICEEVSKLRDLKPHAKIAIACRSFDPRTRRIEEALNRRGLPFKIDARMPLKDLPEIQALIQKLKGSVDQEGRVSLAEQLNACAQKLGESPTSRILAALAEKFSAESAEISRHDFYHWIATIFERRDVAFASSTKADVIELVSVKRLSARTYDYVFLPDLTQGRFPKTESSPGLSDDERFEINQLLGRRVFAFVAENPLEAAVVPARQAFESLWFAFAIKSASQGLYLSSSRLDPKGKEQAQSEFLSAALRVVGETKAAPKTRRSKAASFEQRPMHVDPQASNAVFARWLGVDGQHPLTATRLEAFAMCPFRALVQRVLGIDDEKQADGDLDPRAIGKFVHAVLELFFRSNDHSRTRLTAIIQEKRDLLVDDAGEVSPLIIEAHVLWLTLILERVVSNILKEPPIEGATPRYFEYAVGFEQPQKTIRVGENQVSLGGVIDRVDVSETAVTVIDYKLSSMAALRQKAGEKELLETHFQTPLYIRLLLEKHPELRSKDIYAHLISVRDGSVMQIKGDLKGRALDDEREDSLYAAIQRVMSPILDGKFDARPNDSCSSCYLKRVCRT